MSGTKQSVISRELVRDISRTTVLNLPFAKDLLREARGNINRRKQYTRDKYDKDYDVRNQQNQRKTDAGNDLRHLKWCGIIG